MNLSHALARSVIATVSTLAMGGCYYSFDSSSSRGTASSPPRSTIGGTTTTATAPVSWTSQPTSYGGDMGNVHGFDNTAAVIHGTDTAATSSVRIDAENTSAQWWAMTQFTFQGSLSHPSLVPGAHFEFGATARPAASGTVAPLFVSAIGCSGPRHGNYTYDHGASAITIDVGEGPDANSRVITFNATFVPSATVTQHVTGSFVYSRE